MIVEDQAEIIEFLATPGTYGVDRVERLDTHTASVFLAGSRAYKLKRAVRFDYVDFSTLERRRRFCEAEVRLNRRTAPRIYQGVTAVTREADGRLAMRGTGPPVEWLVEMNRFPQEALLDRLAAAGTLPVPLMKQLGTAIARLHGVAEQRPDHGGKPDISWVIDGNATGFAEFGGNSLDLELCQRVTAAAHRELDRHGSLLEARRQAGFVRECHGDLHLRNIVLLDERPTLFDSVEFNDQIACVDVLYDLAFLLMDLWHRNLPRHACAVWNQYLVETGDLDGIALMPLFLSCRAAVRAKTSATAATVQADLDRRRALDAEARAYLGLAESLLEPPAPSLIAIGGLSGSGKSTLAAGLAPFAGAVPGAVVLRTDDIRKRLAGVPPLQPLGPAGYTPEMSARVYRSLLEHATLVLAAGHAVVADAVFARPADRAAIERVAVEASVPFEGLWLDAPQSTLLARVEKRHDDPSDADATVVRLQALEGDLSGWHRLDASTGPDRVECTALDRLHDAVPRCMNGSDAASG